MNFEFRLCEKSELPQIVELSKHFADEKVCNGIVADNLEYFQDKQIFVCVVKGKVVGYAYGTMEISKENHEYIKVGEKFFYLDEVYVLPEYRNMGIGKNLCEKLIAYAKRENCQSVQLNAVAKDYKKLLKFYIENFDFSFWSAFLTKKL